MMLTLMNEKLRPIPNATHKSKSGWIALRWWNFPINITMTSVSTVLTSTDCDWST